MNKLKITVILLFAVLYPAISSIVPNPIISRGKPVYTSSGTASYLVDNKFNSSSWSVSNNSWIAIKVDSGPSKVFLNWNNPSYPWSVELAVECISVFQFPVDYNLLISSNSTVGSDGDWTIVDSIRSNIVAARGHLVDFTGAKWIKMAIINGGGTIDEIEVFDASDGDEDVWFFPGTSISANTYKESPPAQDYADVVHNNHSAYNPVMIRGGIGCINSTDFKNNLPKYLKMAGNAHFWAIEMGTNDAWGGTNANVTLFKNNMQIVIDSCKNRGIQPIIARIIATNSYYTKWQVHLDFLKAVDDLTANNNLIPGPDLYTWFLAHPEEIKPGAADGVHPNATGDASIQRLWAQKMDSLHGGCSPVQIVPYIRVNSDTSKLIAGATVNQNDTIILSPQVSGTGTWLWSGPASFSSSLQEITVNNIQTNQAGNYVVYYTYHDTCTSAYAFKIKVKAVVEIKAAVMKTENIKVFPNPALEGKITISITNVSGAYQMQIYNILGTLSYKMQLTKNETEINTKLSKGIYVIKIYNGQNFLNQKLVLR